MTEKLLISPFGARFDAQEPLSCLEPLEHCREAVRPQKIEVFAISSSSFRRSLFALSLLISMALRLEQVRTHFMNNLCDLLFY